MQCNVVGSVDDVGGGVIDPLDMQWVVNRKMIVSEGEDVGSVELVHATYVYSVGQWFICRIFIVNRWHDGVINIGRFWFSLALLTPH